MTIKICHMTSVHDSDDIRIFQKECISLAQQEDFDVYLVAPGKSRVERGVKVVGVGDVPASRVKRMLSFAKKVYEAALQIDADIYHFHDPELLSYGLKLKRKGKHVIFDSHENTSMQLRIKQYLPGFTKVLASKIYYAKETKVCSQIDAVIFPAIDISETPFIERSKRLLLVDNVPRLSEFTIDMSAKQPRVCCCIGTLSQQRGITSMLRAAKHIDGKLILAGEFSSSAYKQELENEGLLDNIDYRGKVGRDAVINIYNESSVGLSTALRVGQYDVSTNFATKEYEYMAMGIPMVRTDFEGTRAIFEKYDLGISIEPENPEEIAKAVNFLFDNPDIMMQKGKNGRKLALDRFNWESESMKIVKLYWELLGRENNG